MKQEITSDILNQKFRKLVNILTKQNKTISVMESCTGGFISSLITDIEGASKVLNFSAVTYSNEYKIKMGVNKNIIDTYSVYSRETSEEMSKAITSYTKSSIGIGITGKLNRQDENNNFGKDNEIFISIYDELLNKHYNYKTIANKTNRRENKMLVANLVADELIDILNN